MTAMQPRLYVDQKITAFVNQYEVYGVGASGTKSGLEAFAQQKRLAIKEKVLFYTDEQKTTLAFSFRAEKAIDVHGRYIVEDAQGVCIGMFRKEFGESLLRSSWILIDKDGSELLRVQESSAVLAAMRRFAGLLPIVGDIVDILVMFLRYHFQFVSLVNDSVVGEYRKVTLFRDHYSLSMTDEANKKVDWRVLAAMGVALDALQSR
jgi:hypothetical protein